MPHDCEGSKIKVGDQVILRATVKSVQEGDEFCNLTVDTLIPMHPTDQPTTITLNTRQVQLETSKDVFTPETE